MQTPGVGIEYTFMALALQNFEQIKYAFEPLVDSFEPDDPLKAAVSLMLHTVELLAPYDNGYAIFMASKDRDEVAHAVRLILSASTAAALTTGGS